MRPFTKAELIAVAIILFLILVASGANLKVALMRARDVTRKTDLTGVASALEKYQDDFGFYPLSIDGKIAACAPVFSPCKWGVDALRDVSDMAYPAYLTGIPQDPQGPIGLSYVYFSNGSKYQIFASLEVKDDDEYKVAIEERGINCGSRLCNFGRASGRTPLDKSIEEYESELEKSM